MDVEPGFFRKVMGHFVTGVTVVTTLEDDRPWGITVNALSSVSLEPALIVVALDRRRRVTPKLRAAGRYAVNILAEGQEGLADCFAGAQVTPGRDDFCGAAWNAGPSGLPLLDGAIAWLECTVVDTISAGDHDLFIGSVDALATPEDHPRPLLYYRRRYLRIEQAESLVPQGYQEG
jgi:3-hydroxy-9,10-secoandrosta-1,3,5(10)-triene-9,17-dione monooxygenase reductase component